MTIWPASYGLFLHQDLLLNNPAQRTLMLAIFGQVMQSVLQDPELEDFGAQCWLVVI